MESRNAVFFDFPVKAQDLQLAWKQASDYIVYSNRFLYLKVPSHSQIREAAWSTFKIWQVNQEYVESNFTAITGKRTQCPIPIFHAVCTMETPT